jgi:hypothetical protein
VLEFFFELILYSAPTGPCDFHDAMTHAAHPVAHPFTDNRRDLEEAKRDLFAWLQKRQQKYPKLLQLGRGEHRADPELLQVAAAASQALEVDEHAGVAERRNQTADTRGEDLESHPAFTNCEIL